MKILNITKKDEKNVVVHLDNDEKLFLSYEVLMKNGLKKNDEVSESRFSFLVNQNQLYHIKQRAARYLGRRLHSVNELRIKLRQKGYDSTLIDTVLADLVDKNYLNDYEFSSLLADENIKNKLWGKNKLKAELIKKGIQSSVIDKIIAEKYPEGNDVENALSLAEKKLKQLSYRNLEEKKLKEKIMSYLFSRGYDYQTVNNAVEEVLRR
ncbi:MAG: regulatory protein RecX [Ignavibacteriaceae bacterium]